MSSRSTSPIPPSSGAGGGGGTLSNDALYAPLSSYAECPSHGTASSIAIGAPSTTPKKGHSLSLQTSSSLRESSLITFLASVSSNLKTSHPQECHVYRSIGGSIARYGMGDANRATSGMRNVLEGKLSNRSLVLVGGGVHSHASASRGNLGKADGEGKEASLVGMGTVASAGKRERKRMGGNGMFGCISNKKRKKLLMHRRKSEGERSESKGMDVPKDMQTTKVSPATADGQEQMGYIVATLHEMWISYMKRLLSTLKEATTASLALGDRRLISHLLATAEHVGMSATIAECPSRRHLVNTRCVVVYTTRETWKVAMLVRKKKGSAKKGEATGEGGPEETSGKETGFEGKSATSGKGSGGRESKPRPPSWKIVLVPKRGTVLDVELPWAGPDGVSGGSCVTVRLET